MERLKEYGYGIPTAHCSPMVIPIGIQGNQKRVIKITKTAHAFGVMNHTHGTIITVTENHFSFVNRGTDVL
jgi:hypothetical protein